MSSHPLFALRPQSAAATAWLALCAAAPAVSAPLDFHLPQISWPPSPPDMLLIGSGVVLVIALAFALTRRSTRVPRTPEGEDLRWWKNPPV